MSHKRKKKSHKQVSFASPVRQSTSKNSATLSDPVRITIGQIPCVLLRDPSPSPTSSSLEPSTMAFLGHRFKFGNNARSAQPDNPAATASTDRRHIPSRMDACQRSNEGNTVRSPGSMHWPEIQSVDLPRRVEFKRQSPTTQRHSNLGCFKCMAMGHWVKDCRGDVCC